MAIFFAVLFMLVCWAGGFFFLLTFGFAYPQYGSAKFKLKYGIFFYTGLAVLFIFFPFIGFYIAK